MGSFRGKRLLPIGGTGPFGRDFVEIAIANLDLERIAVSSRSELKQAVAAAHGWTSRTGTGSLQVSQVSAREADVVAWIVRKSFKEYRKGGRRPLSARLRAGKVKRQLRSGEKEYALARLDQIPVGVIGVRKKRRVLMFGPVGVVPKHRAQGVGAALLQWAEERAAEVDCVVLKGEVLWGLASLVHYYRRMGYDIERTHDGKTIAVKRLAGVKQ